MSGAKKNHNGHQSFVFMCASCFLCVSCPKYFCVVMRIVIRQTTNSVRAHFSECYTQTE